MAGEYLTLVEPNDVLFGAGRGQREHEGNIKFCELVSQRMGKYMATKNPQVTAKIAKAMVDTVFDSNGHVLKNEIWRSVNFRDSPMVGTSMLW